MFIYQAYIEAGQEKASLFPMFMRQKANIVCDIIFDEETRSLVSSLGVLPKDEIRQLMAQTDRLGHLLTKIAEAKAALEKLKSSHDTSSPYVPFQKA
jgi:hypothetical protein